MVRPTAPWSAQMRMQRGSLLSLGRNPSTAIPTPGNALQAAGQPRALRKVIQRPKALGRGPRGCPNGAGLDEAGSRLLPRPGRRTGPAPGAARRGGGAAWSARQLQRPGILDPSPRQGKGPRSPLPTSSSWRGVHQAPARGVSAAHAGVKRASNPRPGSRVLRPGAWRVG